MAALLGALLMLPACTPALNWREVRPAGAGLLAMFPCKPKSQARTVQLAGALVEMSLHACTTEGATYAVGWADTGDPARVSTALAELRRALVVNLDGEPAMLGPTRVEGMTPNPEAQRLEVKGALPDGGSVHERAALFAKGTRVFQAAVIGSRLDPEALETFFTGLKLQ